MRINVFVGSSIDFAIRNNRLSLFHELGTNELYINNYFANENHRVMEIEDILVWGLGLKWYLDPLSQGKK